MSDSTAAAPPSTAPGRAPHRATPTPSRPPLALRALLSLLSGLALAASFPSHDHWYLAPLGVTGLALATRDQRPRRAALLSMITGWAYFLVHLSWSGIYVGWLPWVALATLEASYLALTGALMPLAWRARGGAAGTVLAITGLWVLQEAVRGRLPFGGFPWGRLAFSQADAPTLGYAALGGAPLVTAVVAAAGALLALALDRTPLHAPLTRALDTPLHHPRRTAPAVPGPRATPPAPHPHPWLPAACLLATALALPAAGAAVPRPAHGERTARIAAVQGNVPRPGLDFNAERRAVLSNHVQETLDLAARIRNGTTPRPDLVVWPENASDIDPLADPDAAALIQRATDAVGVPVLVGTLQDEPDGIHNTSILWGPTGSSAPGPTDRYVKRHPAPFGEYIPYRSFFRLFSDKVDLVRKDFVGGPRTGTLDTAPARLGPVICFEVAYDSLVHDQVQDGADLLTVQTNNATFGHTDESVQQLAMSRLRAVETGRSVVHISTVGISALIAPDGSTPAVSDHFTRQTLQATLPLRTARTLAVRLGPLPEILLALAGLLLALTARTPASQRIPRPAQYSHHVPADEGPAPVPREQGRAPSSEDDGGPGPSPAPEPAPRTPAGHATSAEHHRPHGRNHVTPEQTDGPAATGRVLVIIPTYNERESLPLIVRRVRESVPAAHVLVADDASPDGTGALADDLAAADHHVHVLHRPGKQGLGAAYLHGFSWGTAHGYDVLVEMDADGSHQPEQLPDLLARIADGADLAMGSRWVPGGEVVNWPWHRQALSRGGSLYTRILLGIPLRDATGGYRAFRRTTLEEIGLDDVTSQGYCFQIDLAWRTLRAGLRVDETPITFVERELGASKMNRGIVVEALWRVLRWGLGHRWAQMTRRKHAPR